MCLGVYGRVLKTDGELATVDFGGGLVKEVLVGVEEVCDGDFVVVHAGVIVSCLSEKDFMEVFNHIEDAAKQLAEKKSEAANYIEQIRARLRESLTNLPSQRKIFQ